MARLWPPWSSRTWLLLESLAATGVFVGLSLLTRLRRANLCGGSGPSPAKESRGMRLGRARSQHSEAAQRGSEVPTIRRQILSTGPPATLFRIPTTVIAPETTFIPLAYYP